MTDYTDALDEVGGLSNPSKMPCRCWSIPAIHCITGSKLAKQAGTVCSICYAMKGLYVMPCVQEAMDRRFRRLVEAFHEQDSYLRFKAAFITLFRHRYKSTVARLRRGQTVADDGRVFRWFDSGDLQSTTQLCLIGELAYAVPMVQFWLPTKEVGMVEDYLDAVPAVPPNLTIRLSVAAINRGESRRYAALRARSRRITFAASHEDEAKLPPDYTPCPAPLNEGKCGDCRRCWDANIPRISYLTK